MVPTEFQSERMILLHMDSLDTQIITTWEIIW